MTVRLTTDSDWLFNQAGDPCSWCPGSLPEAEPFDLIGALTVLCRGHAAEWCGESIDGLNRAEAAAYDDMTALGYFDNYDSLTRQVPPF